MEIRWYGTASVEIRCSEGKILFDPFVPLASVDADTKIEDFDGFDKIFITHGHVDHIMYIPDICKRNPSVKIYCTQTPYITLLKKRVPKDNLVKITSGEKIEANGFTVSTYHGRHACLPKVNLKLVKRFLSSPYRGNLPLLIKEHSKCKENDEILYYEVERDGKRVGVMGSMNLRDECAYPVESDALILPYNGWEDNFPPAVRVLDKLKPRYIYLDHFDNTFPPLTSEIDLSPVLEKYKGKIEPLTYRKYYKIT